jgi:AraC family transcriptional regulator
VYNLQIIYESIEYIEKNLKNPLSVKKVSDKIGYSLFHFSRMFNTIVKYSPYDYIMRRRLSKAAIDLIKSDKKIIDIALDYQFNSHETFSRAFNKMFNILPNRVKKNNINYLVLKTKDTFDYLEFINKTKLTIPEIIESDKINLVGFTFNLSDSFNELNTILKNFIKKISIIKNTIIPEKYYLFQLKNKNNNYIFKMLGVETKTIEHTPDNFVGKIIPANKYIKFTHNGKLDELHFTLNYIYQTWLPKSNCKINGDYELLFFNNYKKDIDNSNLKIDILIPIKINEINLKKRKKYG